MAKMSKRNMRRFAELAQDFYNEKQEASGMIEPIRKAWASNEEGDLLIIVSTFGVHSRELAKQTGIPWKGETVSERKWSMAETTEEHLRVARELGGQIMEMAGATAEAGWTFQELRDYAEPLEELLARTLAEQREAIKSLLGRLPENSQVADCVAAIDGDTHLMDGA